MNSDLVASVDEFIRLELLSRTATTAVASYAGNPHLQTNVLPRSEMVLERFKFRFDTKLSDA